MLELIGPPDIRHVQKEIYYEALKYLAGYVAYRFRSKYEHLGNRAKPLIINFNCDWISYLTRGGLMMPSDILFNITCIMEECFNSFHGEKNLSEEDYIFQKVVRITQSKLSNEEKNLVPFDVLLLLVRTRTYIRLKFINKDAKQKKGQYKRLYKAATWFVYNKQFLILILSILFIISLNLNMKTYIIVQYD